MGSGLTYLAGDGTALLKRRKKDKTKAATTTEGTSGAENDRDSETNKKPPAH